MAQNLKETLQESINSAVTAVGYEYVGHELIPHGRRCLLRVYIDAPGGVTIDDCGKASKQISAVMDVEDPISNAYVLEVSSPGADRPLFTLAHYAKFVGHEVKLKLLYPINERKTLKGTIKKIEGDTIAIDVDDETVEIDFSKIAKGNIVPDFG